MDTKWKEAGPVGSFEDHGHADIGLRCLACLGLAEGCHKVFDDGGKQSGFCCLECGHTIWDNKQSVSDYFEYLWDMEGTSIVPGGTLWVTDGIEQVEGWYWRHYEDVCRDADLRCKRCLGEMKKINHIHAEHWVCFNCEASYEAFSPGDMAGWETPMTVPDDVLWVTEGELLIQHPMD